MALLSKLTGSLPNPLNILQGEWKIQYRNSYAVQSDASPLDLSAPITSVIKQYATSELDKKFQDPWQTLGFDSIISVNEIEEADIVRQQVEKGSFRSVNKIRKPKMFKVTAAVGGTAEIGLDTATQEVLSELRELLPLARKEVKGSLGFKDTINVVSSIASALTGNISPLLENEALDKASKTRYIPMEFRIITPHNTTDSLNLIKFDYTFRRETGRNLLIVDMTFEEILEGGSVVSFTKANVKLAGDSDIISGGIRAIQGA